MLVNRKLAIPVLLVVLLLAAPVVGARVPPGFVGISPQTPAGERTSS
jgi:hypothetical protein